MKRIIFTGIAALSLAACATGPSAYGPASTGNGIGFHNTQIENDRFRISYTGRSPEEAHDFALLRASEIALAEGYSHFKVLHGQIDGDDRRGGNVSSSIGIGVGSGGGYHRGYGRRSHTNVGVGIGINDLGRALNGDKYTSTVEVLLKRSGGSSDDGRIYDAKSVADNIRPPVFQ